jgi:hypothetical protein
VAVFAARASDEGGTEVVGLLGDAVGGAVHAFAAGECLESGILAYDGERRDVEEARTNS